MRLSARLHARNHFNERVELFGRDRELLLALVAGLIVQDLPIVPELFLALIRLFNNLHGVEHAPCIVNTPAIVLNSPGRVMLLNGKVTIKRALCGARSSAILAAQ